MAAKFRYNSKTFLTTLLSLTTVFVGLVLLNSELSKRTSTQTQAKGEGGGNCTIQLLSKVTVPNVGNVNNTGFIWTNYNAYTNPQYHYIVENNQPLVFRADCSGFTTQVPQIWYFSDSCGNPLQPEHYSDESGPATPGYRRSYISHTFPQNGDYYVTVLAKEGTKKGYDTVKVGVYNRNLYLFDPTNPTYQIDLSAQNAGKVSVEKYIKDLTANPNSRLASFSFRTCSFGATGASSNNKAIFEEVLRSGSTEYKDSYRQYYAKEEKSDNTTTPYCTLYLNAFWDKATDTVKGKVDNIKFTLTAPKNGTAKVLVDGFFNVVHRIYSTDSTINEYKDYPACKVQ